MSLATDCAVYAEHPDTMKKVKAGSPGWNTKSRPNGGYCRVRYARDTNCKNEQAIVVGTISNANMVPSLFETYLKVAYQTDIVLEHQVGDLVTGIYLQDNSVNSSWHVFARIAIRRS